MRWFVIVGLAIVLVVGVASLMNYIGPSLYSLPLPPRPADEPLLVLGPPEPDSEPPPLAPLPDLTQVDCRVREPANLVRPRYCLLVFGPQAKTRVWVIEDGEKLYVDRNANGDLTDAGEAFPPIEREEFTTVGEDGKDAPYREWTYAVDDLSPGGGPERHKGLKLVRYQTRAGPADYVLSVRVNGVLLQYAGWGPLLAEGRQAATVVHFGGPVLPKPLRGASLSRGKERPEVHFGIGTPGLGKHSFAYVGYEAVPAAVRPVVEIAWPTVADAVTERFALARRC